MTTNLYDNFTDKKRPLQIFFGEWWDFNRRNGENRNIWTGRPGCILYVFLKEGRLRACYFFAQDRFQLGLDINPFAPHPATNL